MKMETMCSSKYITIVGLLIISTFGKRLHADFFAGEIASVEYVGPTVEVCGYSGGAVQKPLIVTISRQCRSKTALKSYSTVTDSIGHFCVLMATTAPEVGPCQFSFSIH